jgi:hypothetical protein
MESSMSRNVVGRRWVLAAGAGVVALGMACAPLAGELGSVLTGNAMTGEIRSLDTRRSIVRVRDDRGGREESVRYDSRTRVVYAQRQYPVSSLRRGDRVRVQLTYDRNGTAWADRIDVRDNGRGDTRDRMDTRSNRVQRLDATVREIDHRRGYFTVQENRTTVIVQVPQRVSRDDARRFDRLRRGNRVRADVRYMTQNRAELVRFR